MNFQTFWNGRFTPFEVLCLRSFTSDGHTVDLYAYDDVPKLPGVTNRDASEILPKSEYREDSCFVGHPGVFSDHFRYKLLYERGGWWIDTDVMLVGTFKKHPPCFGYQEDHLVNNAIMCFEPMHAVMRDCLYEAERLRSNGGVEWGDTGPYLLTTMLAKHRMLDKAEESETYYPLSFLEIRIVLQSEWAKEVREKIQRASFLHLWNAILVSEGVNKCEEPERGSWLWEQAATLLQAGEWQRWAQ